jgi:phosphonate transport system substrate-binding protein
MGIMANVFKTVLLGTITTSIILLSADQAKAIDTLIFGTHAFEKPTTTVRKLRPILNALEQKLETQLGRPIKIRMRVAKSYHAAIADLTAGRVDFGRYGQAAYVIAKAAKRDLKVISVEGDHKKKTFKSVIVVRQNSPIQSLADFSGRSFAFGDEHSTTGRYLPQAFLARNGVTANVLSDFGYLGRHDRVAAAVADGTYDAGAVSEWVYKDLKQKGASLRTISSFSNMTKPWVARSGLPKSMIASIRSSLINLRGVKVLDLIKKDCFLPGHDHDYSDTRNAISDNWAFFLESEELPIGLASGPPE